MRWLLWTGLGFAVLLVLWVGTFVAVFEADSPGAIIYYGQPYPFLRDWARRKYWKSETQITLFPGWWPLMSAWRSWNHYG